jgi:Ribbon-helix-helix domain
MYHDTYACVGQYQFTTNPIPRGSEMGKKSSSKSADTSDANRVRMSFYIDKPALATLHARNEETGIPMAHMIRSAIDQYIGSEFNKAIGAEVRTVGTVDELKGK